MYGNIMYRVYNSEISLARERSDRPKNKRIYFESLNPKGIFSQM